MSLFSIDDLCVGELGRDNWLFQYGLSMAYLLRRQRDVDKWPAYDALKEMIEPAAGGE